MHDAKQHWEKVYQTKQPAEVSWFQQHPAISLELISLTGIPKDSAVVDVGGGASILVDSLLEKGFTHLTVLDISSRALLYAKERLGKRAGAIHWVEGDVTEFNPGETFDLWHDRAVFHFLTSPQDREKYIRVMDKTVKPGGHVVMASFALDGPPKCSGLAVERYSPSTLSAQLGSAFSLVKSVNETHITPGKTEQKFTYCYFRKLNQ